MSELNENDFVKVGQICGAMQMKIDALQAKLDIAVEALRHYKSSDMHWSVSTEFADEALAKLEEK